MRAYCVRIAAMALLFATAALLLGWMSGNERVERIACMAGVCATEQATARAYDLLLSGGAETPIAVERFRTLVARNPASPFPWATLAEGLAETGDAAGARSAMLQALRLGPLIPQIRIRAANLFSALGDRRDALRSLVTVLHGTAAFDQVVFNSFRRMELDVREVLAVLPENRRAARAYFDDLRQRGRTDELKTIWDWMLGRGFLDQELAAWYFDALLAAQRYSQAHEDWTHYLATSKQPGYEVGNRVYNPEFERAPSGSPFDWRFDAINGIAVGCDSEVAHAGKAWLRIVFAGEVNTDFHHVSQQLVLSPGEYQFEAWIRTAGLTTDHGIAFRVFDAENPVRLDVQSAQFTGTREWTPVKLVVAIPLLTRIVRIGVLRTPSFKFDNKIAGTVWVDSVALTPSRAH